MADQVYFGTIFTNNDPDTNGLLPGALVELDSTRDNSVIKVSGANSPDVIGVVIVGGSKGSQVTICGFTGQRIRININGASAVSRGDQIVSDGTIPGNCKVDNSATPDQVFAVALAAKTAGVGSQVEALYLAPSVSNAIGTGASANAYYLVGRATNAPTNAINLGALTTGFLKATVSGSIATITTDTATGAPETSKYILQQPDASLTNAQALSALSTGLLKNTTSTGILSTAIINTDYPAVSATYVVASNVAAPPNAVNLGALTSGLLKQTVVSGVATISTAVSGTDYQPAGAYLTALTGDVLATGPGSVTATIATNAVTSAKFRQSVSTAVVGNPTSSTANVTDIVASTDNTFLGRTAGALSFQPLTPINTGGVATWSLTGVFVVAVDGVNGNDANTGSALSVDVTQANIAAATIVAAGSGGVNAKRTLAGAAAIIPTDLAGRTVYVVVSGGTGGGLTYADPWTVFDRWGGTIVVYATGTNSTAGATAFTGTTNDLIGQGAQTSTGQNVTGYHPVSNATSNVVQLVKVGGGTPTFGAEPGKPLFVRLRGDISNATTATQNHVNTVVAVTAADTIQLDAAITYTTADTFYLEDPGPIAPGGVFYGTATFEFVGIQASSSVVFFAARFAEIVFCQVTGSFTWQSASGSGIITNGLPIPPNPVIGPTRVSTGMNATGGVLFVSPSSLATTTTFSASGLTNLEFDSFNVVGTNATISGTSTPIGSTGSGQFGSNTAPQFACRVLGKLTLNGVRMGLGYINLPSTTQAVGVTVLGMNDISFLGSIYGGLKTNVGMDFSQSIHSRITYSSILSDDGSTGLSVTGVNGDIYYGTHTNIGSAPIYQSYDGFAVVDGSVQLSNGDKWVSISRLGPKFYGNALAVAALNHAGGIDIPANKIVRFGRVGDGRDVTIAQADTMENSAGALGFSLGGIKVGTAAFVMISGTVEVGYADVPGGFPGAGGWPVYLSDTVAGLAVHKPPTNPGSVVRQIGWATDENEVLLVPDNWAIGGGLEIGGALNHWGLGNDAIGGLLQRSALTGAITAAAGANTTAFGSATALSVLANATNASAIPAFLAASANNQVLQELGGVLQFHTLDYSQLTGTPAAITALTGDVLATGPGSVTATIATHAVSYAKMQQASAHTLLGNPTGSLANISEITLGSGLSFSGTTLTSTGSGGTITALTGDVTASGSGSVVATLVNIGTGVTAAGFINFAIIAAPTTPASGHANVYVDSTSLNFAIKNSAGTINHGIQSNTGTAHQWISAIADNGSVTLTQPAYTDLSGSVPAITSLTGDVTGTGPGATAATISAHAVTYAKFQTVGANSLLGNPTGSAATASEITLGAGLAFVGTTLTATSIGTGTVTNVTATAPIFITSTSTVTPNIVIHGSITSGDTVTTPQNLGSLASGLLKQTVSTGVATLAIASVGTDYVQTVSATTPIVNIGTTANPDFALASSGVAPGVYLTPSIVVDVYGRITLASPTNTYQLIESDGTPLTGETTLNFVAPLHAVDSGGSPFRTNATLLYDTNHVINGSSQLALANQISINGGSLASNTSLVVGRANNANLDRIQFLVGGGALGSSGTSDNTLFDVSPANTTILTGVTGGVYSTTRIRGLSYGAQSGSVTPTEICSLYIDGPSAGGFVGGLVSALHIASGLARFSNGVQVDQFATGGGGPVTSDTAGTLGTFSSTAGGNSAVISSSTPYYVAVNATSLLGSAFWFVSSSSTIISASPVEYTQPFIPRYAVIKIVLINNPILSGTMTLGITHSNSGGGGNIGSVTLNSVSTGVLSTGTITVSSPGVNDTFGFFVQAAGTVTTGQLVMTATILTSPYPF